MLKPSFYSQAEILLNNIDSNAGLNIFICANDNETRLLSNEILLLKPDQEIHIFPSKEILPYDLFSSPKSVRQQRSEILRKRNKLGGLLLCPFSVITELFPPKSFIDAGQLIELNQNISIQDTQKSLELFGYQNVDRVLHPNEYALRGGILDFFSQAHAYPVRLEFFGDEVESIRYFDPSSQSSIKQISNTSICDGEDIPILDKNIEYFINAWRKEFSQYDERECDVFQSYINKKLAEGFENYLPLYFEDSLISIFDLFENKNFFFNELVTNRVIDNFYDDIYSRFNSSQDHKFPRLLPEKLFCSKNKILMYLESIKPIQNIDNLNNIHLKSWEEIVSSLDQFGDAEVITASISSLDDPSIDYINHTTFRPLRDLNVNKLFIHKEYLSSQMYLESNVATDAVVFSDRVDIEEVKFQDGQLVIHEDYGLGLCKGLDLLNLNSHTEECLKILFDEDEILYLPLRSLHKISRFPNHSDKDITLDSLSSKKFSQKKESIKKDIYDSAVYFLETQAKRSVAQAFRLKLPSENYQKFDQDFPFTLTKDQTTCIDQIIHDLNLIKPMDRVICGDVGFGKTEVAMRAAFIACYNNRQTLMVVPSTILCDQHFESFIERFANFPVTINCLSRRKTDKEKKELIEKFNNGEIDILIGTHALFNEALKYTNTALLILDEEHRFGAKQKDLIKSKCERLHILSMSATPIPRTMNQIFTGLKDFSYLYTPPNNRLSVHTYKHVESNNVLTTAIDREITRSGQVFIVQNNIQKHDALKHHIHALLPNISIASAHGKLTNQEIKSTMQGFKSGLVDVLICTTIVEMGIDIPNANTMIVLDSHKFGLAQLHQLRGRVGRSTKQGYCYYLVPTEDTSKDSQLRLNSLLNNSALGSGYFIAQEDMEIRGAGELLGDKQSGHIHTLGMSLYLSLLKDAVKTINNETELPNASQVDLDFNDHSLIPNEFIPSPNERLKFYQKLNLVTNEEDISEIANTLKDIGGKLPKEIEHLLDDHKMKLLLITLGINKVTTAIKNIHIKFDENISDIIYSRLLNKELRDRFSIKYLEDNKISIGYDKEARSQFKLFVNSLS